MQKTTITFFIISFHNAHTHLYIQTYISIDYAECTYLKPASVIMRL